MHIGREGQSFCLRPGIALFGDEYVQEAGRQTFELFEQRAADSTHKPPFAEEDLPRYYIFGHDHIPAKILLKEGDIWSGNRHVYYFNTGSWLSWFAGEDVRRLRTGGGDLEFTFLKIWKRSDEWSYQDDEYDARLLRWNDAAGRAEDQLVIGPKKEEDSFIPALLRPTLFVACLFAAIGLYIGVGQGNWLISVILGLVLGAVVGLGLYLGAQRRLSGQTEA